MVIDLNTFRRFERKLTISRWIIVFVLLFSLDNLIYRNSILFTKVFMLTLSIILANGVVYFLSLKLPLESEKSRVVFGMVEWGIDVLFITYIAYVFGMHSNHWIFFFHFVLAGVTFFRFAKYDWMWALQGILLADMWFIKSVIHKHQYVLEEMNFRLAMILFMMLCIIFYSIAKEYKRLTLLVHTQKENVEGLEKSIQGMYRFNRMNKTIFESQSTDGVISGLLDNLYDLEISGHFSVFMYGENGVESDAKVYEYPRRQDKLQVRAFRSRPIYCQKELQSMRKMREYRYCILNYEPILADMPIFRPLFEELVGTYLEHYMYLFNINIKDQHAGLVILNTSRRLSIDQCKQISKCIDHASLAIYKVKQLALERSKSIYDTLTGIKSRLSINETLPIMLRKVQEKEANLGILFIDIDNFKVVNDTYGHSTGDLVLKEVSSILKEFASNGSLVGRYGGEEFLVVLHNEKSVTLEVAEKIRGCIEQTDFSSIGVYKPITVSIGIAFYPDHGTQMETLISHADAAMYEAKKEKNKVCLYDKDEEALEL